MEHTESEKLNVWIRPSKRRACVARRKQVFSMAPIRFNDGARERVREALRDRVLRRHATLE